MTKVLIELLAVLVILQRVFAFDFFFEVIIKLLIEIVLFELVDNVQIQTVIDNRGLNFFARHKVLVASFCFLFLVYHTNQNRFLERVWMQQRRR